MGRNSAPSFLNLFCGRWNALYCLSRERTIQRNYCTLFYVTYRLKTLSFCVVKQESHTRTHKWAAEESLRLPVSAAALKAHTVNWGSGFRENTGWILILICSKKTVFKSGKMKKGSVIIFYVVLQIYSAKVWQWNVSFSVLFLSFSVGANELPACWRERLLYYDLYLDLTSFSSVLRAPETWLHRM